MKNKEEKGSVVLFVVIACLFIIIMLMTFFVDVNNKKLAQDKEVNQITRIYNGNEQEMEEIYSKVIEEK